MSKLSLVFLLFPVLAFSQTFSSTINQPLLDDGTAAYYDLPVSGLPDKIDTLFGLETVCINLTHVWTGDLFIAIVAPDGTETVLVSGVGGDSDNFENTCFNGDAPLAVWQGWGPFAGTFRPDGLLTVVNNGQNPNGAWRLKVLDTYAFADSGEMLDFSITFGNDPQQPFPFYSSTLPIVKINTGGAAIFNEQKIAAGMQIIRNPDNQVNHLDDPPTDYDGKIAIELRGNSSLGMPKKSYGFETRTETGENNNVSLLTMPAENDWVLLANFSDKSLMRNYLTQELFRRMGRYAPRMEFCELVLDGEYRGVYVLGERIKKDSSRVDIATLNPDDNEGEELTGGYILKVDWNNGTNVGGFYSQFNQVTNTDGPLYIQYHYPKADEITPQQQDYIASYVDSFEVAMKSANFQDPDLGWRRFGGEESFIDFILLNEFTNNVDAYWLSTFLYKDKNGKLKPGPPWDYDLAWNNANYSEGSNPTLWRYQWLAFNTNLLPFWWQRIWQDTAFVQRLSCRWEELRNGPFHPDSLQLLITETEALLDGPQQVNFQRWPILGTWVWPNVEPVPQNYFGEVLRLRNWASARTAWMDGQLPALNCNVVSSPSENLPDNEGLVISPNPFSEGFHLHWPEQGPTAARLELTDAFGRLVANEVVQNGAWFGTDALSSGVYFLKWQAGERVLTRKVVKGSGR